VASRLPWCRRHAAHGLANVIATASTEEKRRFVLANGARAALDPRDPTLVEQVKALTHGRGVELALDPTGRALFIACLHALAPLGVAVYLQHPGWPAGRGRLRRTAQAARAQPGRADLLDAQLRR